MLASTSGVGVALGLFLRFQNPGAVHSGPNSPVLAYSLTPQCSSTAVVRRRQRKGLSFWFRRLPKKGKLVDFMLLPTSSVSVGQLRLSTSAGLRARNSTYAGYSVTMRQKHLWGFKGALKAQIWGAQRIWPSRLKLLARLRKGVSRRRDKRDKGIKRSSASYKPKKVTKGIRRGLRKLKLKSRTRKFFGRCVAVQTRRARPCPPFRRRPRYRKVALNSLARGLAKSLFSQRKARTLRYRRKVYGSKAKLTANRLLLRLRPQPQLHEYIKSTWGFIRTRKHSRRYEDGTAQNQIALLTVISTVGAQAPTVPVAASKGKVRRTFRRRHTRPTRRFTFGLKVVRLPVRFRTAYRYIRKILKIRTVFKRSALGRKMQRFYRYFAPNTHTQPVFSYRPKKAWTAKQRQAYLCKRYSVGGRARKGLSLAKRSSALALQKPVLTMRRWFGGRVLGRRGLRLKRTRVRKKTNSLCVVVPDNLFF